VECTGLPDAGYLPFRGRLYERALEDGVPVSGSMELTSACNLRCVHCYMPVTASRRDELTFPEVTGIVDQLADEGCLWLLLTGGEPLLRDDFTDIYRHVKRRGILPMLFTNATLVSEYTADLLESEPPFNVEVSVYGATEETFERMTGVKGSYHRCMEGVDKLLERGVRLSLKTMATTLNAHEVAGMKALAGRLGVQFRFDTMLNSGIYGDRSPLRYRLPAERITELDRSDPDRMNGWVEVVEKFSPPVETTDRVYQCGAGRSTFHIDPWGKLSVCMMSRVESFDLKRGSFREGWREFIPGVLGREWSKDVPCRVCSLKSMCGQCPGWGLLEHGDPEAMVEHLCETARARAEMLGLTGPNPYDTSGPFQTEHTCETT
jgi:radical SAM protein with 4Fe4S-binding SPASM domain